jgi:hypothetical protein
MIKIPYVPSPAQTPALPDAEVNLIAAIFRQALTDLKPTADPYAHAAAVRWWRNQGGELQWFCDALGLDMAQVQRQIRARYPEVWAPRQLEMDLGVAS